MRLKHTSWDALLHDPVFWVIVGVLFAFIVIAIREEMLRRQHKTREVATIIRNLERLQKKKNINISIEKIKIVQEHLFQVAILQDLLADQDLNHYNIHKEINERLDACIDFYRRAGVPDRRITQAVTDSKF